MVVGGKEGGTAVGLGVNLPVTTPVYVFSRSSGQMLQRLQDFPGHVSQISFSPDGRWLAGSDRGLQVIDWRTPDKSAVRELSNVGPKTSIGAFSVECGQSHRRHRGYE